MGITGTKGKTTTAYILRSILTAAGCKTGMIGTVGTFIGDKMVCDARNTTPESLELHQRFAQMEQAGCHSRGHGGVLPGHEATPGGGDQL